MLAHLYVAAGSKATVTSISLGAVAYGLAAIGPGIGIGLIFGHASRPWPASPRPAA